MNVDALPAWLRDALAFAVGAIVEGTKRPANRCALPAWRGRAVVRFCRRERRTTGEREVGR